MGKVGLYRSFLFVPGNRPDRYKKALASGADAVIIDLEDAVAPDAKVKAREEIRNFAINNPGFTFWVRVNGIETQFFNEDVSLCDELPNLSGVFLPKAESANDLLELNEIGKPIIPLIESAAGTLAMSEIAKVSGVERLCFGAMDLMLEMGVTPDTTASDVLLNDLRCRLLFNSQANGLQKPIDTVYVNISDEKGLYDFAQRSKDMGFVGMLCIHPKQIETVHKAFAPNQVQLEWAKKIVDCADSSGSTAFSMDGQMIDQPIITRARCLLDNY